MRSESVPPSTEIENLAERGDGPSTTTQITTTDAASLPVTAGGDPLPPSINGSEVPLDVQPPPAIEGMAPLSAAAMSSFASAANGVTNAEPGSTNGAGAENGDGKVILNGVSST
jgi:poly(A) polymerase